MLPARLPPTSPEQFSSALAVISAMITPAVLILGSSSLIAATSTRLGRILDRSRKLAEQIESLLQNQSTGELSPEKLALLIDQLQRTVRRARLLQRAMTALYLALGAFVASSIALGVDAALSAGHTITLVILVLVGACFLLYASLLLVAESRVAVAAVNREMEFVGRLAVGLSGSGTPPPTEQKLDAP